MRTSYILAGLACVGALLSGCTYQAIAVHTSVPASEIRVDRVRDAHAVVVTNLDSDLLIKNAKKPGLSCTAHNYPVEIGPALESSLGIVMDSAFGSYEKSASLPSTTPSMRRYTFRFDVEEFEPVFSYSPGFWSGTAQGRVTISGRVQVFDGNQKEILRTMISGSAHSDAEGGCDKGAEALGTASTKAIADFLENFVLKVINSDELDRVY